MGKHIDNANTTFSYYAVALIDILKQKKILKKMKFSENEQEKEEFIKLWKKSGGVVKLLRESFDCFFNSYSKFDPNKYPNLTKEQIISMTRMRTAEIKKQQFSDTMIFYTSLEDNHKLFPINNIQALFLALSGTLIMALSIGEVFRGGIEIQWGSNDCFGGEELYGRVLSDAYELESKIAGYPRIVIGKHMYNYLRKECSLEGNDIDSKYRKDMANNLKKMVCLDSDGVQILDYLGEMTKYLFGIDGINRLEDPVKKASIFIKNEYVKYKNKVSMEFIKENIELAKKNMELANRYFMLNCYFRDRQKKFWS